MFNFADVTFFFWKNEIKAPHLDTLGKRLSRSDHLGLSPFFSGSAAVAAGLSNPPTPEGLEACAAM